MNDIDDIDWGDLTPTWGARIASNIVPVIILMGAAMLGAAHWMGWL